MPTRNDAKIVPKSNRKTGKVCPQDPLTEVSHVRCLTIQDDRQTGTPATAEFTMRSALIAEIRNKTWRPTSVG
jgi:hypothetical protein